jgi:hypothetical protein
MNEYAVDMRWVILIAICLTSIKLVRFARESEDIDICTVPTGIFIANCDMVVAETTLATYSRRRRVAGHRCLRPATAFATSLCCNRSRFTLASRCYNAAKRMEECSVSGSCWFGPSSLMRPRNLAARSRSRRAGQVASNINGSFRRAPRCRKQRILALTLACDSCCLVHRRLAGGPAT